MVYVGNDKDFLTPLGVLGRLRVALRGQGLLVLSVNFVSPLASFKTNLNQVLHRRVAEEALVRAEELYFAPEVRYTSSSLFPDDKFSNVKMRYVLLSKRW